MLHVRVRLELGRSRSSTFPKEPQLQLPLGIGKEPQLQIPRGIGKIVVPTHLRDQEDTGVDYSPRTHTCLTLPFG